MYKEINFGPTATTKITRDDGSIIYYLNDSLQAYPTRITERLVHWAEQRPQQIFLAKRVSEKAHDWEQWTYAQTYDKVQAIGQYLINQNFGPNATIAILSDNSLEHALLALAAMHVGIPYTPISPAYSLLSTDFAKLQHCLVQMNPNLVFVQNTRQYGAVLAFIKKLLPQVQILSVDGATGGAFEYITNTRVTDAVAHAYAQIQPETVAKVLFTSGSTGLPKGVINTHAMCCANLQQISQVFPFMQAQPPVFVDWLPWNHTFGGNHNFGLCLYNGGTLYLDEGKPTAKGIDVTVKNLLEISPTAYFNVPKGFEMLIPHFEKNKELSERFFKNLNMLFYAGASLAQPIWNKLEQLALETIGVKIPIITGLGCTESGPSAMFANWPGSYSGLLGVPVAGMQVKLVPNGDKYEARYKAPNVTPGYWQNADATQSAFDEEGYYKTGDAVKFVDSTAPDKGLLFDGRIAEDFKLSSGTWVNVGIVKAKLIAAGSPIIQDAVLTGLDKDFIGAILFLNLDTCQKLIGADLPAVETFQHATVKKYLDEVFHKLKESATGSSTKVEKYVIALEPPSIDLGEITDKGSLNQRQVLQHRQHLVEHIYS